MELVSAGLPTDRVWLAHTLNTKIAASTTYSFQVLAWGTDMGGTAVIEIVAGGTLLASSSEPIEGEDPYPHTLTASYRAPSNPTQLDQNITLRLVTTAAQTTGNSGHIRYDSAIMDEMHGMDDGGGGGPPVYVLISWQKA